MKKFFGGISAVILGLPGLGTYLEGLRVPPDMKPLFGGASHAAAVLFVAVVFLLRGRIAKWSKRRVAMWAIGFGVVWILFNIAYVPLSRHCVIVHESRGVAYFPVRVQGGDIEKMIARAGGRYAAIERYGIDAVRMGIESMPDSAFWDGITTVILLTLYQGLYSALAVAFAIAWAGTSSSIREHAVAATKP